MMEYQRLGDYIREVNIRNRELKVTKLMGISMTKKFRPSTSNVVGTDLSNYKIVEKNIFVFDTMSVIRVHKVPIAINNTDEPIIVSPAYHTFEVIDPNALMPEYLMMWFCRSEFDRYADFKSDSAIRGGYGWDELCDTIIDVPTIARQREIVSEYETLTNRIQLNEQMIARLEETAQAIYLKECVSEVSEESMAFERRRYTLKEFAPVITGKKDANIATDDGKYKFFTCSKDDYKTDCYSFDEEALLLAGNGDFNVKYYKGKFEAYQRTYVLIPNDHRIVGLLYNAIRYNISEMAKGARGSVISFLTKDMVENVSFYSTQNISDFGDVLEIFNNSIKLIYNIKQENEKLTELQSLLLARMGK